MDPVREAFEELIEGGGVFLTTDVLNEEVPLEGISPYIIGGSVTIDELLEMPESQSVSLVIPITSQAAAAVIDEYRSPYQIDESSDFQTLALKLISAIEL